MRRVLALLAIASTALTLFVRPAGAIPSPSTSSVDPCLVFCPVGDIAFHVVVRDLANNPVPNSLVTLDFSRCPGFVHCLGVPSPLVVNEAARTVARRTDAAGLAVFEIPMGGICPGGGVSVFASTAGGTCACILLATRTLASPDRDGNLFPDLTDEAAIQALALAHSTDPTADFDCNGIVDAADVGIAAQHRFHACPLVVPVAPRSWGAVKILYR